ncbi:MAG: PilZ domain-containing protein [Nitrospirae bacterium]|nr:PilZ domain-containing protein [Nitrospirota bacterium]
MEESGPLIQRRGVQRITADIGIRYFFSNTNHSGAVKNISGHGMFIQSWTTLPPGSLFPIIICNERDVLIEHVMVKHLIKTNKDISGMGVEILYPSQGYLEFVKKNFSI